MQPPRPLPKPDEPATLPPNPSPAETTPERISMPGYELLTELGRGGMGVVYKARQVQVNRMVALKMILAAGHASEADVTRFLNEAEAVARQQHPNIVQLFEAGRHEGLPWFSLEFCSGGSLADKLRGRPLLPQDAARLVEQIARGVAHAHQKGVVHRDLKPHNVLLAEDGTPKVTDFGLARRVEVGPGLTATGVVLGTPSYMAPEQANGEGKRVGPAADVYGLGAILYECLTGRPPFQGPTTLDILLQVLNEEPVAVRLLQPKVPRDLETIVCKCLEKEPGRRYLTAQDLADDLRRFLDGHPIQGRRPSPAARVARWAWKKRAGITVAVAAAVVALLLLVFGRLGWDAYEESQQGRLVLTTDKTPLQVEVFAAEKDVLLHSFAAPQAVTLPAGTYRLRLSASGRLSETWAVDVKPGEEHTYPVALRDHLLWPELTIAKDEWYEILDLGERADLIVISPSRRSLRRLNGATGKPVWPSDLVFDASSLPKGGPLEEWQWMLDQSGLNRSWEQKVIIQTNGNAGRLLKGKRDLHADLIVRPAPDLDGDGVPDLVLLAQRSNSHDFPLFGKKKPDPAVMAQWSASPVAISGKDGKVLWWYHKEGHVVGLPAVVDVNGDGTPDLVCAFASMGNRGGNVIVALSGKDGTPIWRYPLDPPQGWPWWWTSSAQPNGIGCLSDCTRPCDQLVLVPIVTRLQGKPILVLGQGKMLLCLDLTTGQKVWDVRSGERSYGQRSAPQLVDRKGAGQPELLLLRDEFEPKLHGPVRHALLSCLSVATGKIVWEKSFDHAGLRLEKEYPRRNPWDRLLVADLNGDGRREVFLPASPRRLEGRPQREAELELLAVATHELLLWSRYPSTRSVHIDRMLAGPDLDGDGWRDLFVTWMRTQENRVTDSKLLFLGAAALSGKDGRTLWQREHVTDLSYHRPEEPAHLKGAPPLVKSFLMPASGPLGPQGLDDTGPLRLWQAGADGPPQLIVPRALPVGSQPVTFILSATSGNVTHVLPDVSEIEVADLNGGGVPALLCTMPSPQGARLRVIQHRPDETVRRIDAEGQSSALSQPKHPMAVVVEGDEPPPSFWEQQRAKSSLRLLLELLLMLLTLYLSVRIVLAARKRQWAGLIGRVLFLAAIWMAALPLPLLELKYTTGRDPLGLLAMINAFALRWSLAWLGAIIVGLLLLGLVKLWRRRFLRGMAASAPPSETPLHLRQ